jgi:hypothetical protein
MAVKFLNRCAWFASTAGVLDFTLDTAFPGFYAPAGCANPAITDNGRYNYFAVSLDGTEHEEGEGIWTAGDSKLAREVVRNSSSGTGGCSFTAPPVVYMGGPSATSVAQPPSEITATTTPEGVSSGFIIPASVPAAGETAKWPSLEYFTCAGPWTNRAVHFGYSYSTTFTTNIGGVLGADGQGVYIYNDYNLTSFAMPDLEMILGSNCGITFEYNSFLTSASFPNLRYSAGSISFYSMNYNFHPDFTEVSFPALKVCLDGFFVDTSSYVTTINLPLFRGGDPDNEDTFNISNCPLVTSISLPSFTGPGIFNISGEGMSLLTTISIGPITDPYSYVDIGDCPILEEVDLTGSTSIGELQIQNCPSLTTLLMPDLEYLSNYSELEGESEISMCPLLVSVSFPSLIHTDMFDDGAGLQIFSLDACTTVDLPALEGGRISIEALTVLTTLSFPAMTGGEINVYDCPALVSLDVSTLVTGELDFSLVPLLEAIDLSAFVGDIDSSVDFGAMDALDTVDVSSMTAGELQFSDGCPLLTSGVAMPTLTGSMPNFGISFFYSAVTAIPSFATLTAISRIGVTNTPAFTVFDFPLLATVGAINISEATVTGPVADELNFPALVSSDNAINLTYLTGVETISFPVCTSVSSAVIESCDDVTDVNFPSLANANYISLFNLISLVSVDFGALVNGQTINIGACSALTTLDFSSVTASGGNEVNMYLQLNPVLATVDVSNVQNFYTIYVTGCSSLTSLNLSSVVAIKQGGLMISGASSMTDFSINPSVQQILYNVRVDAALTEASVDTLLVLLAGLDGSLGSAFVSNVTLQGDNAPPSATGLAAITTLEGRGCFVQVNS